MEDEPHEVVKLLLARMDSHPEEFSNDDGRWAQWLDELMPFVTEKERVMLRKPMMQAIHEEVMDEMLNGEDRRRRKQEEENEYERHLAQAIRHTKMPSAVGQYQQAIGQLAGGIYGNGGGGGASLPVSTSPYQNALAQGIVGRSPTSILVDECANIGVGNGGTGATMGSITAPQPQTTLSTSAIDQIKQALGIKK